MSKRVKLAGLTDREFTKILDWPGYRVYRHEINESTRTETLGAAKTRQQGDGVLRLRRQVDMWEPFRLSIEQWAPNCRIVYDKFHIMQHANRAIEEVRRADGFAADAQRRQPSHRLPGLVPGRPCA